MIDQYGATVDYSCSKKKNPYIHAMINNTILIKKPKKGIMIAQVLFWISFFSFFFIYEQQYMTVQKSALYSLKSTLFYLILTYVHAFYILRLISIRKISAYVFVTLSFLGSLVLLRIYFEYIVFYHTNTAYQFRDYYNFSTNQITQAIISGVNAIVISTLLKFTYDYFKLQKNQQEITSSRLKMEMKYLKSQINPHFLFNTLNSLLYLTYQKSDLAPDVVERLSKLMRYILEKKDVEEELLSYEIEFIKAYLSLEKIRIPHISINFNLPSIMPMDVKIPPMIFLPLVENAFKHGIEKSNTDNYVNIDLRINDYIYFTVENKVWGSKMCNLKDVELGIDNLKKRLEHFFMDDYKLSFVKTSSTFKAKLVIPLL